jgi:hypothetical protein
MFGVALSGGGSRALTAGMGHPRALNQLTLNGRPQQTQVKALSTLSGGAWRGGPFIYLPPGSPSDAEYLGPWIEDQSTLTAMLSHLPAGNAGVPISSPAVERNLDLDPSLRTRSKVVACAAETAPLAYQAIAAPHLSPGAPPRSRILPGCGLR